MSEVEADISKHIERLARELGIDAKCRLMHRDGFEDEGEWFPPYDEYEVRADGRILNLEADLSTDSITNDLVRASLEHAFLRGERCVLVGSAAMMFSTWAGAEVSHAKDCDGKCDLQRQLDAQAKLRQQSMEMALRNISGEDEEDD